MKIGKRERTGRERDEEAAQLLDRLRQKLYSDRIPVARRAAYNLSWMQEDGLEILEEALFTGIAKSTRRAAVYGLRKMQGRMKKKAKEVLKKAADSRDKYTREIAHNAVLMLENKLPTPPSGPKKSSRRNRVPIRELPPRNRRRSPNSRYANDNYSRNRRRR